MALVFLQVQKHIPKQILDPGVHTFRVTAFVGINGEGDEENVITGNTVTFTWNIVVPDTEIILAVDGNDNFLPIPNGGTSTSGFITFAFQAVVDGQPFEVDGFQCSLDGGAFSPCNNGIQEYGPDILVPGTHTFSVRFVDGDSIDPTPATFTWTIIPDTVIDSAVDGDGNELIDDVGPTSTSGSIDFEFSAELDGLPTTVEGFTCELLDEIGPVDCSTGSISFDGLLPGTHTFEVFAFTGDVVDPSPATFTWTIVPDTVIDSAVDGDGNELIDDVGPTSTSGSIDFEFSAELDGLPTTVEGFTCELLDEIGPVDCSTGSIFF